MIEFSSRRLLGLIEGSDFAGSWRWIFASREHGWSNSLYRILGLDPAMVVPSYDRLLQCVHPDDLFELERPDEVPLIGLQRERVFRVLRPNGTLRTLRSLAEVRVAPDGRPLEAGGLLIDESHSEVLARARSAERHRNRLVFEQVGAFISTSEALPSQPPPRELIELTGISEQELLADRTSPIVSNEREHWIEQGQLQLWKKAAIDVTPHLRLANGSVARYRIVMIPTWRMDGSIAHWTTYCGPIGWHPRCPGGALIEGLEDAVEGRHLRAARALLDWSMTDFSRASGLSVSTIRRLEEAMVTPGKRSRSTAITALRRAGIRFSLIDGDVVVGGAGRMLRPVADTECGPASKQIIIKNN